MKDNKWYIEKANMLKDSLDEAFDNIKPDYTQGFDYESTFYDDPLYKAKDLMLHFIHLVYSYDSGMPLNIEAGELRDESLSTDKPSQHKYIKNKIKYYIDFFIEYLTDFDASEHARRT